MIRLAPESIFPIPSLPESESFNLGPVVPHRCHTIYMALQIKVNQLFHVCSDDLICRRQRETLSDVHTGARLTSIHKNDFVEVHGEQDIQK